MIGRSLGIGREIDIAVYCIGELGEKVRGESVGFLCKHVVGEEGIERRGLLKRRRLGRRVELILICTSPCDTCLQDYARRRGGESAAIQM